ncbi:hypothetical protein FH968_23410 [Buttiauxella sp. B2]|uniref:hypothetical protein n=1 Tax=Buttiauxella sp. B2 TaxID=2587812 RepID=UPI00111F9007|nr:hypothetical protein [Buttiauxella sp. B2]TNV09321.1 hypothetical protein FH968_23410 [Buttiauxella sp. B2]
MAERLREDKPTKVILNDGIELMQCQYQAVLTDQICDGLFSGYFLHGVEYTGAIILRTTVDPVHGSIVIAAIDNEFTRCAVKPRPSGGDIRHTW